MPLWPGLLYREAHQQPNALRRDDRFADFLRARLPAPLAAAYV